ncbi:MAG: TonB-dependent receptor [Bryobacteraceae bacterium]|nr:TonB-dependent receptor [Bryobacteraceae bacterium]
MTEIVGGIGSRNAGDPYPEKFSRGVALLCLCAVLACSAFAAPADLSEVSLEQLLQLEVVSVSRKEQPLSKSAAAICVLTGDDIRRSGALNIPDALRMVPGLHVGRIDTTTWAVSARGFNGEFSNKLLVMVDGRSVYTPIFGGVFWNAVDVPLADIDRIEVIRGPGGTMWGANAMNGVINILTKSSRDTDGTLVVAGSGTQDNALTYVRHGARLSDSLSYRVFGKFQNVRSMGGNVAGQLGQPWLLGRTGFRVDARLPGSWELLVEGDAYRGSGGQVYGSTMPEPPYFQLLDNPIRQSGGFILARFTSKASQTSQSSLQVFVDNQVHRTPLFQPASTTFDVEYQRRFARGRHDFIWGGNARTARTSYPTAGGGPSLAAVQDNGLFSGFLQDEISFSDNLQLVIGTKLEHNTRSPKLQIQPSVKFNWSATPTTNLWASVSRAVRSPNRLERELDISLSHSSTPEGVPVITRLTGDLDYGYEQVVAYETGLRTRLTKALTIDATGFVNQYSGLGVLQLNPARYDPSFNAIVVPLTFANGAAGSSRGVEISLIWVPKPWLRVQNNWSHFQLSLRELPSSMPIARGPTSGSFPTWQNNTRLSLNLPRRFELDTSFYGISALEAYNIPASLRVDVRLGWRYSPNLEFSLTGQDLGGGNHPGYISESSTQSVNPRRRVYGQIQWRF